MVEIELRGVKIEFPFTPYQCQLDYMDKVLEALQEGKNALLESPTGTGKTLCLLCATLAWQDYFKRQAFADNEVHLWNKKATDLSQLKRNNIVPKIIYSSRTHSQLSQCMKALKNTKYNVKKVAIIASRDQLCLNTAVNSIESQSAKIFGCRVRVKNRSCFYYNNFDKNREAHVADATSMVDIEDLIELGRTKRCCSYFLSREMRDDADIIFMPYNYLLDSRVRRNYGINLDNCVLVFDEAHNIENVCEESASIDLTSTQVALCIEELKKAGEYIYTNEQLNENDEGSNENKVELPNLEHILMVKQIFICLENFIKEIDIPSEGITANPQYLLDMLSQSGITNINIDLVCETLSQCKEYIGLSGDNTALKQIGVRGIEASLNFLRLVLCENNTEHEDVFSQGKTLSLSYRVHIRDESKTSYGAAKFKTNGVNCKVVSFWCLTPGKAMSQLVRLHNIRNVILTSGTLYPVHTLKMDMKIEFEIELRNSHVVNRDQLLVSVCTKGPDGTTLNSSYEFREDLSYNNSLGNCLVNLAKIIPRGLLIVFPSYSMMRKCVEKWEATDIYNRLVAQKKIIVEPQDKAKFTLAMKEFESTNCDPKSNSGSALLAVARGKVSEGLDLSDNRGRAVIIIGLPFPAMLDPRIRLKMAFLDEQLVSVNKNSGDSISGRSWYRQQAYRAVNQAMGRVIRHSRDYGLVVLCDERFANAQSRSQMPTWMQPMINVCDNFGVVVRSTINFFRIAEEKYSTNSNYRYIIGGGGSGGYDHTTINRTGQVNDNNNNNNCDGKNNQSNLNIEWASNVDSFCYSFRDKSEDFEEIMTQYSKSSFSLKENNVNQEESSKNSTNLLDLLKTADNGKIDASVLSDINNNERKVVKRLKNGEESSDALIDSKKGKKKRYKLITHEKSDLRWESAKFMEKMTPYLKDINDKDIAEFQNVMQGYQENKKSLDLLLEVLLKIVKKAKQKSEIYKEIVGVIKQEHKEKFEQFCDEQIKIQGNDNDQIIEKSNDMQCVKCGAKPPVIPLAAPCKHVCCFQCWRNQIELNCQLQRRCPKCQQMIRRRQLVKLV